MNLAQILIDLVLGAVIGALGGMIGIGGGLIAIPILGLFFGLDQQHAQGTSMVMVAPNVLMGLYQYWRRGMNVRIASVLAITAIPLTYVGARFAVSIASAPLRRGFALFLIALCAYMVWKSFASRSGETETSASVPWPFASLVGAGGGLVSGIFSVGGAVFAVPLLSLMFGLSQAAAQGLGLALVAPGTLVGMATYAHAGDIEWSIGLPMAIGGIGAVPWGVAVAYRLPERWLRVFFSIILGISAVALWSRG